MRHCANCGTPEDRRTDGFGGELTNLDPTSGLCVDCLIASARTFRASRIEANGQLPLRDVKSAAAGDTE